MHVRILQGVLKIHQGFAKAPVPRNQEAGKEAGKPTSREAEKLGSRETKKPEATLPRKS